MFLRGGASTGEKTGTISRMKRGNQKVPQRREERVMPEFVLPSGWGGLRNSRGRTALEPEKRKSVGTIRDLATLRSRSLSGRSSVLVQGGALSGGGGSIVRT